MLEEMLKERSTTKASADNNSKINTAKNMKKNAIPGHFSSLLPYFLRPFVVSTIRNISVHL